MSQHFAWLSQAWAVFLDLLDPLSKLATITAVVIAGIWTYHIHEITGESDDNPQMTLLTQVFAYKRLLVVRIRDKNVGKVPIPLAKDALTITLKRVPGALKAGRIDINKQQVLYADKSFEETDLEPGVEMEDVREFVIPPGLYHIEATLDLPDGDFINDVTVENVS
jgi:hypothetical protein